MAPFVPPMIPPTIAPTPAPAAMLADLALDALALDGVDGVGAKRIAAAVNDDLVKGQRQLARSIGARGAIDGADDAVHLRARRHEHAIALHQIDDGCRLEPVLDLRGV